MRTIPSVTGGIAALFCLLAHTGVMPSNQAAETPARPRSEPPPPVTSPEVAPDRRITFRILAPKAETVRLGAGDLQGFREPPALSKQTTGVWEVTVGPVAPGSYRYNFDVDGVAVLDPRNPLTSESNANPWSLVHVPGAELMEPQEGPHGAIAEVTYYSKTLQRFRRMHVYTPPGYERGKGRFPVFYLLHGASDSDDSWTSVGRAGVILDNLIAQKRAKPMVVVMPAGHTRPFVRRAPGAPRPADDFIPDFLNDIMPYVESHYRVRTDRKSRALAGLSMGGGHTLSIGIPHLERFGYLGVFSSGVFGITGTGPGTGPTGPSFEERNQAVLDDAKLKKGLRLFWFATGKDDFLLETSRATVAMLKKHHFDVVYHETEGAHTWLVWREYLGQFAPQLFQ